MFTACDTQTGVITLRYGCPFPEQSSRAVRETYFMDWAEEQTNGRVQFERYYGGILGGIPEQGKFIQEGAMDLGVMIVSRVADLPLTYLPVISVAGTEDTAYQFTTQVNRDHKEASALLEQEWEENNLRFLGRGGIYYLGTSSPEAIMTKDFPFTTMDDLKGKRIGSAGTHPEFENTGITMVNIQPPDMYESIARGVVDGMMGSTGQIIADKLYETGKHIMEIHLWSVSAGGFLAMNLDAWNSLPGSVQRVFDEGEQAMYDFSLSIAEEERAKELATFQEHGITVGKFTEEEIMALLVVRNEARTREFLDICERAGKLNEARLMVKYCDEILAQIK
jgi:TRAP-type C4-dicarboxylate transport system substrate-binding protein